MKMKSVKRKGKLIDETVEHLPKEWSQAVQFFLEQGGKISGNVFEQKYWPSHITKAELEIKLEVELKIEDKKRKLFERFQDIIENNYRNNESTVMLNLQRENFGVTPEWQESAHEEEDHLVGILHE